MEDWASWITGDLQNFSGFAQAFEHPLDWERNILEGLTEMGTKANRPELIGYFFFNTLKIMSSYSWSGGIFYLGEYVNALNLPWHYPIVWILISTPILYIILFIIGSILIISKIS